MYIRHRVGNGWGVDTKSDKTTIINSNQFQFEIKVLLNVELGGKGKKWQSLTEDHSFLGHPSLCREYTYSIALREITFTYLQNV